LAIFAGGIFWIGRKQFLFSSTYRLSTEFENVAGLTEGAQVRVGGVSEGSLKRIDLPRRPGEKVKVIMDLKAATRDVIKRDSVAAIKTED
jgi:phospholipid/cholesterol/gamma-HCH transport system substrate-binding protein